mgnify:CR=1 FL=1
MCLLQSIVYIVKGINGSYIQRTWDYLSCSIEINIMCSKNRRFFSSRVLDISELSVLASTFLAHDDELKKLSFFLSVPQ